MFRLSQSQSQFTLSKDQSLCTKGFVHKHINEEVMIESPQQKTVSFLIQHMPQRALQVSCKYSRHLVQKVVIFTLSHCRKTLGCLRSPGQIGNHQTEAEPHRPTVALGRHPGNGISKEQRPGHSQGCTTQLSQKSI